MTILTWLLNMVFQKKSVTPFQNYEKPPRHVFFYFLVPFDRVSNFRCECPDCDGCLTMQRDHNGELMNVDRCSMCGQQFIFDDIEFVKKAGGW